MGRGPEAREFTDAVAQAVGTLPRMVEPGLPREQSAALGRAMRRLGALVEQIERQERLDYRRLRELTEQRRLKVREHREAEVCIDRLLDCERAVDLARSWCNTNAGPMRALAARMRDDAFEGADAFAEAVDLLPLMLPTDRYELRAWLRRAQSLVHGTWQQRLKLRLILAVAGALKATGAALLRWADRHNADRQDTPRS
jgi:hypothetical protein